MQNYKNVNVFKRTFYPVHRLSEASLRVKMFAHSHCAMNNGYIILNNCNPSNSHFQAAKFSVYDLMTHLEILILPHLWGKWNRSRSISPGSFCHGKAGRVYTNKIRDNNHQTQDTNKGKYIHGKSNNQTRNLCRT